MTDYSKLLTRDEAIIELMNKHLRQKVQQAVKTKDLDFLRTVDETFNYIVERFVNEPVKKIGSKQKIMWITITKSHGCSVDTFVNLIHTLPKYRLTQEQPQYCFESTAKEVDEFKNIHCHYLCHKQVGINKQQYIRRLEKLLKEKVFNINIQIYDQDFYKDKVDYLMGKKDADQYDKQDITDSFRETYKLQALY